MRGIALRISGNESEAIAAFEAVIAATPQGVLDGEIGAERVDLFVIAAFDALGRSNQIRIVADAEQDVLAQIIVRLRSAFTNGEDVQQALEDATQSSSNIFSDLTGRLIYRALSLEH